MWGRAGRRTEGLLSTSPARTPSTSSSAATRQQFSSGRWRPAILGSRERPHPARHMLRAGLRRSRSVSRDTEFSARAGGSVPRRWSGWGSCGGAARARYLPRVSTSRPRHIPALGHRPTRSHRGARIRASCSAAVEAERAFTHRPPRGATCIWAAPTRVREARHRGTAGGGRGLRRATTTPQPKKDTEVFIEEVGERRERSRAWELSSRRGVGHRAGDGVPAKEPLGPRGDRHGGADPPRDELPTQALWYVLPDELRGPRSHIARQRQHSRSANRSVA